MGSRATKGLSVCTPARYADLLCTRLRCYMRLALEADLELGQDRNVMTYARHAHLWNVPSAGRTNPWASELDNIMFYL